MAKPTDGNWSDRPALVDMPDQWKIMRCSKNGTPGCLILSPDTCGAYVHYWSGRTRLCIKKGCSACESGQAARWRGYLAVIVANTLATRLLELTPSCVPEIDRYLQSHGTLRGAIINLTRKGKVANGELECMVQQKSGLVGDLPQPPDVVQHLCRIWRATHAALPSEVAIDAATAASNAGLLPARGRKRSQRLATPNDV